MFFEKDGFTTSVYTDETQDYSSGRVRDETTVDIVAADNDYISSTEQVSVTTENSKSLYVLHA